MSFIGPVSNFGEELVRPHDIEVRREPNGSAEQATVERVVHLASRSAPTCSTTDARSGCR